MKNFQELFFSQTMNQLFNKAGMQLPENNFESPLHKNLRLAGQLW